LQEADALCCRHGSNRGGSNNRYWFYNTEKQTRDKTGVCRAFFEHKQGSS